MEYSLHFDKDDIFIYFIYNIDFNYRLEND